MVATSSHLQNQPTAPATRFVHSRHGNPAVLLSRRLNEIRFEQSLVAEREVPVLWVVVTVDGLASGMTGWEERGDNCSRLKAARAFWAGIAYPSMAPGRTGRCAGSTITRHDGPRRRLNLDKIHATTAALPVAPAQRRT